MIQQENQVSTDSGMYGKKPACSILANNTTTITMVK